MVFHASSIAVKVPAILGKSSSVIFQNLEDYPAKGPSACSGEDSQDQVYVPGDTWFGVRHVRATVMFTAAYRRFFCRLHFM
jgi:hypothetical protein